MIMHVKKTETEKDIFFGFYEENKCKLYVLAFRILKDEEAAEEAVCTCLTKVYEQYENYCHMSYADLLKLCCEVVKCIAYKKAESQSHEPERENGGPLSELTEEERCLITLQYLYGLKPGQIGKLTGDSAFLIRRKISAGRNKFYKAYKEKKYA